MKFSYTLHDGEGRTQAAGTIVADSHALAHLGLDTPTYHEWLDAGRRGLYALVNEVRPEPADGSCSRCGGSRASCGGPTDPHE